MGFMEHSRLFGMLLVDFWCLRVRGGGGGAGFKEFAITTKGFWDTPNAKIPRRSMLGNINIKIPKQSMLDNIHINRPR